MEERESGNSDKKFMIEDFSREFGEITSIIYDFRDGTLSVSWLIKDEEDTEEIMATVPITDTSQISDIHDLASLEVVDFRFQMVYRSGNEFIGSK